MDLNTTWFLLYTILIIGYAILDGFDLGVGAIHLFVKSDLERRKHLNAIGPVWDGNEVWLVTAGGALFAAFPPVYATVFSGFYLAMMVLLFVMIGRAVSIEFRSKITSDRWRNTWDRTFSICSILILILFGVAVGNIIRGVPVDAERLYRGTFLQMLNPYSIIVGLIGLTMFATHGMLYMALKTDGDLRKRYQSWATKGWILFIIFHLIGLIWSLAALPHLFINVKEKILLFVLLGVLFIISLIFVLLFNRKGEAGRSFLASSAMIGSLIGLVATSMYPMMLPSSIDISNSLTIYNASSTPKALKTMLIIALIGMPVVIGYTIFIYRVFKGKVIVTDDGY